MVEAEKIINGAVTFNMVWGGGVDCSDFRGWVVIPHLSLIPSIHLKFILPLLPSGPHDDTLTQPLFATSDRPSSHAEWRTTWWYADATSLRNLWSTKQPRRMEVIPNTSITTGRYPSTVKPHYPAPFLAVPAYRHIGATTTLWIIHSFLSAAGADI